MLWTEVIGDVVARHAARPGAAEGVVACQVWVGWESSWTPAPTVTVLSPSRMHSERLEIPGAELERLRRGARGLIFEPEDLVYAAHNYAGRRSVLRDPYAFAANGDLAGQPPVYILTSEYDTVRFSGEAYAEAVAQAGGSVRLETEPGAVHSALAVPGTELGGRSLQRIADWLLQHA